MRKYQLAATAALLAVAASPASAAIVIGSAGPAPVTGFVKINSPAGLVQVGNKTSQNNGLDQTKVYGFDEKQSYTLGSNLTVTVAPGGSALSGAPLGVLAKGTHVASHYLFFDPVGVVPAAGSITFNRKILGVIRTTAGLNASDALFGIAGVGYAAVPLRGLEQGNSITFAINGNTLSYDTLAGNPGDSFRVLTGGVPEPATWAFMILGFGLIGGAMRQAKGRTATRVRFA